MDGWMDGMMDGWGVTLPFVLFLSVQFSMDGWVNRWMYGWMDGLRFYVLLITILVISGRWAGDNERMCAMAQSLVEDGAPYGSILEDLLQGNN